MINSESRQPSQSTPCLASPHGLSSVCTSGENKTENEPFFFFFNSTTNKRQQPGRGSTTAGLLLLLLLGSADSRSKQELRPHFRSSERERQVT